MTALQPRELVDPAVREWIHASLDQRPVLLIAPVGAGAEDLARAELERAEQPVWLEPTVGADSQQLIAATVTQIIARLGFAGSGAMDGASPRARTRLVERYGASAADALAIAQGNPTRGWTLADAIGRPEDDPEAVPTIAVASAHRLPEPMLWELRDLANRGRVTTILTSHREHLERLTGMRAPLYGDATTIELFPPDARAWADHLPGTPLAELDWLLTRTRARAATTLEVLAYTSGESSLADAWQRAVSARAPEAEIVLNLASGLHPYAPALLGAIARGRPPYAAIPGAASQRIARALAKLRDMDLVEQPQPRTWQIADPLLEHALKARLSQPAVPSLTARSYAAVA